ncbi:putative methyltransferase [Komagataeibacter saccharivorans NRIC 0614]|nr:putative methyltransferase [Komagataeibacter saccharivorans NRIC 0614]
MADMTDTTSNSLTGLINRRTFLIAGAAAMPLVGSGARFAHAATTYDDAVLRDCIAAPYRPAEQVHRDPWRHPYQSLLFWGLKPGMTVIDLQPAGGYWTYILAPYLARTGGRYIAGLPNTGPDAGKQARDSFARTFADSARFGHIEMAPFSPGKAPLGAPDTADMVISAREIHNWIRHGYTAEAMHAVAAVLKANGIFAVEDHRADPRAQKPDASDGYVAVATIVQAAAKAGLMLEASSEINANPKDTKDYPFGVWSLPPTRKSDAATAPQRTAYDAIGESDRMTLKFRKP